MPWTDAEGNVVAGEDLWSDPKRKVEYHLYMSKLPKNDAPDSVRKWHKEQADMYMASEKGHERATKKTMEEIARRMYPTQPR